MLRSILPWYALPACGFSYPQLIPSFTLAAMDDHATSAIPPISTFASRLRDTVPQLPHLPKSHSTFYRNLEEVLDVRRTSGLYWAPVKNQWQVGDAADFCSGDILGLARSDARRAEFLAEMARHPDFSLGSSGVRLMDGNSKYLEQTERDIAAFHGAEEGLLVGSAFEANVAVWTALPRPGDVIVYDSLVHASTHEGIKQSLAMDKFEFSHNKVQDFQRVLLEVLESHRLVRQGKRSVLVAVESIYSMDGDVCPLQELVEVAREVSEGQDNIQFVVDEAHSVGVVGPKGAGLVCELGLQKEIAVVVHSYGKAIGAIGGRSAFIAATSRMPHTDAFACRSHDTWKQDSQRCADQLCAVCYLHDGALVSLHRLHQIRVRITRIWAHRSGEWHQRPARVFINRLLRIVS